MYAQNGCRIYVEDLLAEHRRLHKMLRLARAAILQSGGPDRDATAADIVRVLRRIQAELVRHFAEEEGGGCLEEAVSRCPRLSTQARRIEAEHPDLLRGIDDLISQLSGGELNPQDRMAMERAFLDLCDRLHTHEAAENDLLRQGFGRGVGQGRRAVED